MVFNARLLSFLIYLQMVYLFRDLLRLLLALGGDLEFRAEWTMGFRLELWPSYVDFWDITNIPVNAALLIWLWRMVEWKR